LSGKVWKGLERAKKMIKMSINRIWVVVDKKTIGALDSARIGEGAKPTKFQNFFLKNW
jgi:hypothetical protein